VEKRTGGDEDRRHKFSMVFGILQHWPWQEGLSMLVDCIGNGAPRVHSHNF
jgi:hypothetical protein